MFRKKFIDHLVQRVETLLPEIKTFKLWNRNVEFADQDEPWEMPALFVEFGEVRWEPFKYGFFRGSGTVIFHLVQPWDSLEPEEDIFRLSDKLRSVIASMPDTYYFSIRSPESTQTNHDHGELIESIETVHCKFAFDLDDNTPQMPASSVMEE